MSRRGYHDWSILRSGLRWSRRSAAQTKPRALFGRHLSIERLEDRNLLSATPSYAPAASGGSAASAPVASYNQEDTFFLHSLPGWETRTDLKTIYLDFTGSITRNTPWNTQYNTPNIITPPYDLDNDPTNFDSEWTNIQFWWERVSELFRPFDVDVTTEDPTLRDPGALENSGGFDQTWGIRVLIGGSNETWYHSNGGADNIGSVALGGTFTSADDIPVFVFAASGGDIYNSATSIGQTLGLSPDGQNRRYQNIGASPPVFVTSHTEYFGGHALTNDVSSHDPVGNPFWSPITSWAPIMGRSLGASLVQWSKGEYFQANNIQDDLAIITTQNGFGYRPDDHGSSTFDASILVEDSTGTVLSAEGIIEQNTDVDYFRFDVAGVGEAFTFDISNFYNGPNLDILASIRNSSGTEIYRSNPRDNIYAGSQSFGAYSDGGWFQVVNGDVVGTPLREILLSPGTYYLTVDGTGKILTYLDGTDEPWLTVQALGDASRSMPHSSIHLGPLIRYVNNGNPGYYHNIPDPNDPEKMIEEFVEVLLPYDNSDYGYSDYGSLGYYSIVGTRKSLLVGVDFDTAGGTSPNHWNLFSGGGQQSVMTDVLDGPLKSELGVSVPYDLTITTTGTTSQVIASANPINSADLPDHAQPLDGLDGYLTTANSSETLTFVWSNLEPGLVYQVYVFGHASVDAKNVVTITGGPWNGEPVQTVIVNQIVSADGLVVNADDSPGGDLLTSLTYYVVADELGQITITVTGEGALNAAIAGLAIAPTRLGSITGRKWNDQNGDGNQDPGEAGLPDWTIYLDLNNDRVLNFSGDQVITETSTVQQAIPDANIIGVKSDLFVEEHGKIIDVDVTLNIQHPFAADVHAYLISPSGIEVELFTDVGGFGDDFTNTTLDDEATASITVGTAPFTGRFRPEMPLSTFDGQDGHGKWTLLLRDTATGDSGTLLGWSITLVLAGVPLEPYQVTDGSGNYSFQNLQPGTYQVREQSTEEQLTIGWRPTPAQVGGIAPVIVNTGAQVTGVNFGNWIPVTVPGKIAGQKWNDLDGNGEKDDGEPGLEGWVIYIDSNNNGVRDTTSDPITIVSTDEELPKPIGENLPITTSQLTFDGVGTILSVEVTLNISHTFVGDLNAYLTSPSGRIVELFTDVGGQYNNFDDLTLADDADRSIATLNPSDYTEPGYTGRWKPEGNLSDFFGEKLTGDGVWTLTVQDAAGEDVGTLNSWSIAIAFGELFTTTDANGNYVFDNLPVGRYLVREEMKPLWSQTYAPEMLVDPETDQTYNVEVISNDVTFANFGNQISPGTIQGTKWSDLDNDGEKGASEPGLPGWTIYLDANDNGELDLDIVQSADSENVPVDLGDATAQGYTATVSELEFSGVTFILDINVQLDITHTFNQDLVVYLISPQGTSVELFSNIGGNTANFAGTTFDDEAEDSIENASVPFTGTFRPIGSLGDFDGENPNGVWKLEIRDTSTGDTGTLNSWSITITGGEEQRVTDAQGHYEFLNLLPGDYIVREVAQPGWNQTFPNPSYDTAHRITLALGQQVLNADFGNRPGPPIPGDYTRDGEVDAADYILWRHTLTQHVQAPFDGADGNGTSQIEPADYNPWSANFGRIVDDHGNAALVATNVSVPVERGGIIETAGDVDWFKFHATIGVTYTLETVLGSLGNSVLRLIDVNGTTQLESNDDAVGLESLIEWTAPATGFYYLEVSGFGGTHVGTYDLSLTFTPPTDDHGNNFAVSTPVAVPSTTSGIIEVVTDVDWFAFTATNGTTYDIRTILGTLEDSILRVIGTDGVEELDFNDDAPGGIDRESFVRWTAPASGTYYIEVSANDFGTYQVTIEVADITDDHGNAAAAATAVAVGSTTAGEIEIPGDVDWFSFAAIAGKTYKLQTILDSLEDSVLYLYGTNGTTVLDSNDNNVDLESLIEWTAPTSGTYYVEVRAVTNTEPGTYDLSIEEVIIDHGDDALTSTPVLVPSTTAGELEELGDADWFSFNATSGVTYTLETTLGTLHDSLLYLYDTDGLTQLLDDDDSGPGLGSRIVWSAVTSGTYYVVVRAYDDGYDGTYDLHITSDAPPDDHGNDSATASAISVGSNTAGEIEVEFDTDYFSFSATAGVRYKFEVTLGTASTTFLNLYDIDGTTPLLYTYDEEPTVWTAPVSGTYYLAVSDFIGELGTYSVSLEVDTTTDDHGDLSSTATAFTLDTPLAGEIEIGGDVDMFSFVATSGTEYQIDLELLDLTYGVLRVLDVDGTTVLEYDDAFDAPQLFFTAPANGTYYIKVNGYDTFDVGTYNLYASAVSGGGGSASFAGEPIQLFAVSSVEAESQSAAFAAGPIATAGVAPAARPRSASIVRSVASATSNDEALVAWLDSASEQEQASEASFGLVQDGNDDAEETLDEGSESLDAVFELLGA